VTLTDRSSCRAFRPVGGVHPALIVLVATHCLASGGPRRMRAVRAGAGLWGRNGSTRQHTGRERISSIGRRSCLCTSPEQAAKRHQRPLTRASLQADDTSISTSMTVRVSAPLHDAPPSRSVTLAFRSIPPQRLVTLHILGSTMIAPRRPDRSKTGCSVSLPHP
jgi:hypothetical protein